MTIITLMMKNERREDGWMEDQWKVEGERRETTQRHHHHNIRWCFECLIHKNWFTGCTTHTKFSLSLSHPPVVLIFQFSSDVEMRYSFSFFSFFPSTRWDVIFIRMMNNLNDKILKGDRIIIILLKSLSLLMISLLIIWWSFIIWFIHLLFMKRKCEKEKEENHHHQSNSIRMITLLIFICYKISHPRVMFCFPFIILMIILMMISKNLSYIFLFLSSCFGNITHPNLSCVRSSVGHLNYYYFLKLVVIILMWEYLERTILNDKIIIFIIRGVTA